MYKENDYIVYRHDVCKIINIKKNDVNGKLYYVLVPLSDKSLKMSVPVEDKLGNIRSILSKEESLKLINEVKNIEPILDLNDKYIESTYKDLLRNRTHEDLIKIIKTTYLRNKEKIDSNKKISEKDKTYYEKAKVYLYNELCISLDKSFDEIDNMIYEACTE